MDEDIQPATSESNDKWATFRDYSLAYALMFSYMLIRMSATCPIATLPRGILIKGLNVVAVVCGMFCAALFAGSLGYLRYISNNPSPTRLMSTGWKAIRFPLMIAVAFEFIADIWYVSNG